MKPFTIRAYNAPLDYLAVCRWVQQRVSLTQGSDGFALDRWETQFSPERMARRKDSSALVFDHNTLVGVVAAEGPDEFHFLTLENNETLLRTMVSWVTAHLGLKQFTTWSAQINTEQARQLSALGFSKQDARCCNRVMVLKQPPVVIPMNKHFRLITVPISDSAWAEKQALVDQSCFPWANSTASFVQDALQMPSYRSEFHLGAITTGHPNADDSNLAAFTILWVDEVNKLAVFEPVATHENHRRNGLAKSLMLEATSRAYALGIRQFLVGSYSDEAHATYESVGFTDFEYSDQWLWKAQS